MTGRVPLNLTGDVARQLDKIADRIDRITEFDAQFFRRFPHRQYRLRPAGRAEIETLQILQDKMPVPIGFLVYTAIRQIEPGIRARAFVSLPEIPTDAPEHIAREVFERAAKSTPFAA
jgi:hypothetical protein